MKTLSNLLQSLADRHDSGTVPTDSDTLAFWKRLLNRGKDFCADEIAYEKKATVTVSGGTGTLPSDFSVIGTVYLGEVEYIKQSISDIHDGNVYWITGDEENGYTLNTLDDGSFTITYVYSMTDLSSNSDVCLIPDSEAVVAYAYAMLRKSETDPLGDAESSLNECKARIGSMISAKRKNDTELGFALPVFSSVNVPTHSDPL